MVKVTVTVTVTVVLSFRGVEEFQLMRVHILNSPMSELRMVQQGEI